MSVALAAVLLISGAAKLADRAGSRQSVIAFGVPDRLAGPSAWILTGTDLAIATALLFGPSRTPAAIGALTLLAVVSVAVAANLVNRRNPVCHCFGRLSRDPVGLATLARNGLLVSVAGYVAVGGEEPTLFAGLAAVCGASWLALSLLRPRIRRGTRAEDFSLADAAGESWTLERLLVPGRPVLLVFVQPACGACQMLLGDLRAWHRRLSDRVAIALVNQAPAAHLGSVRRERGGYPELLDATGATASAYGSPRPRALCWSSRAAGSLPRWPAARPRSMS